jgi:hypothetical protein
VTVMVLLTLAISILANLTALFAGPPVDAAA